MKTMLPCILILSCVGLATSQAQIPKKSDVPRLIRELRQAASSQVRASAAEGLGALGEVKTAYVKDAIKPLVDALKEDRHTDVRAAAATALGKIRPDPKIAVPALTDALKDKSPGVKIAAAAALPALGAEAMAALPVLKEMANEKNKKVSQAAKDAMRLVESAK